MLRGSVTASLIGYLSLMHVKEFGQLLIEISSLLEKICRGLYYERMKLSYLCTAEYRNQCIDFEIIIQECSLGDCLPKLLKRFCSVEENGHQSYK